MQVSIRRDFKVLFHIDTSFGKIDPLHYVSKRKFDGAEIAYFAGLYILHTLKRHNEVCLAISNHRLKDGQVLPVLEV